MSETTKRTRILNGSLVDIYFSRAHIQAVLLKHPSKECPYFVVERYDASKELMYVKNFESMQEVSPHLRTSL